MSHEPDIHINSLFARFVPLFFALVVITYGGNTLVAEVAASQPPGPIETGDDRVQSPQRVEGCQIGANESTLLVVEGKNDSKDGDGRTGHQEDVDGDVIYGSIQAAVHQANDTATVCVLQGIYRERVDVQKNITLVAPNGATLNGSTFSAIDSGAGGPFGITIGDHASPTIDGFTITRYADAIVSFEGKGHWTVTNVTILNTSDDGIGAQFTTGAWTVKNTVINGTDRLGIHAGVGDWTIENTTIKNTPQVGIEKTQRGGGNWTVRNSTLVNPGAVGIRVYPGTLNVVNTYIVNATFAGISSNRFATYTGPVNGTWTIERTTIVEGGRGIHDAQTNLDWVLSGVNIDNSSVTGIEAVNSSGNWTVRQVSVRGSGRFGVHLSDSSGRWHIVDSRIVANGQGGIVTRRISGRLVISNTSMAGNEGRSIDARTADKKVNATVNWWGSADGPTPGQCQGNVECAPWLTAPPGDSGQARLRTSTPTSTLPPTPGATTQTDISEGSRNRTPKPTTRSTTWKTSPPPTQPGFGIGIAVVAIAVTAVYLKVRRLS